jgi:hypothetical protein
MAAIADADVSITTAGAIRWTGAATTNRHTVLEFIQFLMDKQDDEQAAGDDLLDITVDTPFNRSTDQIVTLNSPFNIDDTFALHLYDGSVSQTDPTFGGETLYSGLNIIGPVETGTEYMILQNGKVLPAFWGVGINPEAAPSLVFSRHLIRSKFAGSQVDGQRITVLARELGDQYRRFPVTLGTGNSVAAIGNGSDIFNTTVDATIAGWTTITNVEGFQELNIDGTGATGQEYYSQWNKGSQTINETYERSKWISQRSHDADVTAGTPTGTDFVIDNATIIGQAQSFIPLVGGEHLTEVRVNVKILAGIPTGTLYCELWDSDDAGSQLDEPTGGELAVSERVLASHITSAYEEVIFRFNTTNPIDGTDQKPGLALDNAMYFAVFRNLEGDAGNNFSVEGAATDQDATQNAASDTGGTWTAVATDDIGITVKSSPEVHGVPGEIFQGINVDVGFDGEIGSGIAEDSIVLWGTILTYDTLVGGPFFAGEEVTIRNDSGNAIKTGGHILFDDLTDKLVIALDTPGAAVIDDNDVIEGLISQATAAINVAGGAIADEDKSGGSGIILAKDDNGTAGEVYLQVVTGVNPVDNNVIREANIIGDPLADLALATATIVTRTVNPEFLGTSTGSNIIGAYGIGFEVLDIAFPDRFTSLDNASRPAQNNVLFTVSALVSGEDRVLVGPRSGTSLGRGQWLVATAALNAIDETVVILSTGDDTVPFPDAEENWPDTGEGTDNSRLRIERDDGIYTRTPYASHDGTDTFTFAVPVSGTINCEVSQVGGTGGQFDRIGGSFLDDGFEQGATFDTLLFTNGGNNSKFTAASVTATTIVVIDDTGMVNESAGGGNETFTSDGWSFLASQAGIDEAAIGNDVFLAFIDVLANAATETFTGVHGGTNRDLFVRVRDGGGTPIKTFESVTAQFLSTPQTIAAVRTDDF